MDIAIAIIVALGSGVLWHSELMKVPWDNMLMNFVWFAVFIISLIYCFTMLAYRLFH